MNNLGLALGMVLTFIYTRVAKGVRMKVTQFYGLIPTFAGVAGEKW